MGDFWHILLLVWSFCVLDVPLFFINYNTVTFLATYFSKQISIRVDVATTSVLAEWDSIATSGSWFSSYTCCLDFVAALLTVLVLWLEHCRFECLFYLWCLRILKCCTMKVRYTSKVLIFQMEKFLFSMSWNFIWLEACILRLCMPCRSCERAERFHLFR